MKKQVDLSGRKIGRWTVTNENEIRISGKRKRTFWKCICECGSVGFVESSKLKIGWSKSCGCYMIDQTSKSNKTHGLSKTKEYKIWSGIHKRCNNIKDNSYKYYGLKGITVCEEWNNFENFIKDMGTCPVNASSIDRINPNLGYYKDNCRWSDWITQARNRSNVRKYFFMGKQVCLSEISNITGLDVKFLHNRIFRDGLSIDEAVNNPLKCTILYKYNGEYMSLPEISSRCGIKYPTLRRRVNFLGMTINDAVSLNVRVFSKKG